MCDYRKKYRKLLKAIIASFDPDDQLPLTIEYCSFVENHEIDGKVAHWANQFLTRRRGNIHLINPCPDNLIGHLINSLISEVRLKIKSEPELFGYRPEKNHYDSFKFSRAAITILVGICEKYLDKAELRTLPPPPTDLLSAPPTSVLMSKNCRPRMEDRTTVLWDLHTIFNIQGHGTASYFAVFDGHSGADAASYASAHVHQYLVESPHYPQDPVAAFNDAFLKTDERFGAATKGENRSGTTAVCALLRPKERRLYIAWAGDSEALLVRNGVPVEVVIPHKPQRPDEEERIKQNGGCVMSWDGVWRLNGVISVSRAIGDYKLKPAMTAEPEVKVVDLDGTEDYLILSSDGLWDVMKKQEAVDCCDTHLYENLGDVEGLSGSLARLASSLGASDNLSVVVAQLKDNERLAHRLAQNPLLFLNSSSRRAHEPTSPRATFATTQPPTTGSSSFDDFGPESNVDDSDEEEEEEEGEERAEEMDEPGLAPAPACVRPFAVSPPNAHNYLGGIDDPDNVAESEGEGNADESEDEWSYVKGEENEQNDKNNETNKPKEPTTVDGEEDIDMESQLNPNAAEFVPVSPKCVAKKDLIDEMISSSPMKGCEKSLDNIIVPTEEEFRRDVANCASSLEDDMNGDLDTTAKDKFNDSQFVALSQCDESEVMSTKAEFGDSMFGLGVSLNNSTSFMTDNRNENEATMTLEAISKDLDPALNSVQELEELDTMPSPDQDDPLVPGTPRSTVAEASHSPNFSEGHFSNEDQTFESEKPQEQPLSMSPVPEVSRPPTFAEIVKRQSPRSSAEHSPRSTPEPPESPLEKRNFNPFTNGNEVAEESKSSVVNRILDFDDQVDKFQEESKQTFEDIVLSEKVETEELKQAKTNPFSTDNIDFATFDQNGTHPVNNQLDMIYSKPDEELKSPEDEKPPTTFNVETDEVESFKNQTHFDNLICQNSDPMQQSFIASPVLENHPPNIELSLMPDVPMDNDASSLIPENFTEKFDVEKQEKMDFGFGANEESESFISIVENRFEHNSSMDAISNELAVEENNFVTPLSPVKEEKEEQPSAGLKMDETHFDMDPAANFNSFTAPTEVVIEDKSPSILDSKSPFEPELECVRNSSIGDVPLMNEPLETKVDHFSQPISEDFKVPSAEDHIPVQVMDDFLATESRENLIETVTNELKETPEEVCLLKADLGTDVHNICEVAAVLDTTPIVDCFVPEDKPEFSFTQAAQQKEEALEPMINVDFVPAEPIGTPVESAKLDLVNIVEESSAELVAAEDHPTKDVPLSTETPPPTPAPGPVDPAPEVKKEGLIAAAAAVAGAAVAVGAAATTKATTKKPTTLSSVGAKKPGVTSAPAKKPTDLASKSVSKTATAKPTSATTKTTSPTKPVAASTVKKTATAPAAAKPSKPVAALKSSVPGNKPASPASKPTTPTSKPSTPTSTSRPSSAPKSSPTKTAASLKSTTGALAAAKPKPTAADKKPLTNGDVSKPASRPASTLGAKKPATSTVTKTTTATKPASTAKPSTVSAAKVGATAAKAKAPVSSSTASKPASTAVKSAVSKVAPAKPSDKTGKETINKQISSAKTAAPKTTSTAAKPAPIKKTDAKPLANGKLPAGKPVTKPPPIKKPTTAVDDKKKASEPTQEHTVTTTNGYAADEPLTIDAIGLGKDDSPLENNIHQDALQVN